MGIFSVFSANVFSLRLFWSHSHGDMPSFLHDHKSDCTAPAPPPHCVSLYRGKPERHAHLGQQKNSLLLKGDSNYRSGLGVLFSESLEVPSRLLRSSRREALQCALGRALGLLLLTLPQQDPQSLFLTLAPTLPPLELFQLMIQNRPSPTKPSLRP